MIEMIRFGITNNGLVRFLSGASDTNKNQLIGSNVFISLIVTLILVVLLLTVKFLFLTSLENSVYSLFFNWYPIIAIVNLPYNNAIVIMFSKMKYDIILIIKALNSGLFFSFIVINYFFFNINLMELVIVLIIVNTITSLLCMYKKWDGFNLINQASKKTNKILLDFGKYSSFTLIGTNLLRNADIFIISISPLGSTAVALFSIPLKLTEIQQIPLRSFSATAFPKLSKASLNGDFNKVKKIFYTYSGILTYLFFFGSIITFLFAKEFIMLVSGDQYLTMKDDGFNIVAIVKILSFYGILLPIDRMTGICLDSINKPNINAVKVALMLTTNIIGNLIAVFILGSLEWVAFSTIIFTTVGIILGCYYLNKEIGISTIEIFKAGNRFIKSMNPYKETRFFN